MWHMYIYLYTSAPPLFPAPPGASAQPKTVQAQASTPRPAARRHRPAARRRSLLGMDKTELSVNRKQTSRAKPANPHCFVGRMSYNLYLMTFDPKVSATDGLTLIYHKFSHLSIERQQQSETDHRQTGSSTTGGMEGKHPRKAY